MRLYSLLPKTTTCINMRQIFQNIIYSITQIYGRGTVFKSTLPKLWYGTKINDTGTSEEHLKTILKERFPDAQAIQVEDVSGGCGAMYNIYVETKEFKGISIPKQHQAIYTALNEQIKQIHGLHVVTKVPP